MKLILHECPDCKAKEGEPCRTPKGRKKKDIHDTRPFSIDGAISIGGVTISSGLPAGPGIAEFNKIKEMES